MRKKTGFCLTPVAKISGFRKFAVIAQLGPQPGARISPVPVSRSTRNTESLGRLVDGEAPKYAELDQIGGGPILAGQPRERLIESDELIGSRPGDDETFVELSPLLPAAMHVRQLAAGVIDKNPPHGLSGGGEKMPAALPVLGSAVHEPQIGLMHQCRGLQCLAWFLLSESRCGQLAQFLVNERQELVGGLRVTLLDG